MNNNTVGYDPEGMSSLITGAATLLALGVAGVAMFFKRRVERGDGGEGRAVGVEHVETQQNSGLNDREVQEEKLLSSSSSSSSVSEFEEVDYDVMDSSIMNPAEKERYEQAKETIGYKLGKSFGELREEAKTERLEKKELKVLKKRYIQLEMSIPGLIKEEMEAILSREAKLREAEAKVKQEALEKAQQEAVEKAQRKAKEIAEAKAAQEEIKRLAAEKAVREAKLAAAKEKEDQRLAIVHGINAYFDKMLECCNNWDLNQLNKDLSLITPLANNVQNSLSSLESKILNQQELDGITLKFNLVATQIKKSTIARNHQSLYVLQSMNVLTTSINKSNKQYINERLYEELLEIVKNLSLDLWGYENKDENISALRLALYEFDSCYFVAFKPKPITN